MNRKRVIRVGLAALLVLLAAGSMTVSAAVLASDINRHVISGGGGRGAAGPYQLDYTIGQPVAGWVSNGPYNECAGFWCGGERFRVFLPLVLRQ